MTKQLLVLISLLLFFACQNNSTPKENNPVHENTEPMSYDSIGRIEKLDDALDDVIPENAKIEILAKGFTWSEGPVWISEGDYLIFSDVPENKIFKWKEGEGKSVYLESSGYSGTDSYSGEPGSNGLTIDSEGKLLLCQHGYRQVAKMDAPLSDPKAVFIPIADRFRDKKFNSPNDLVVHENGDIYFTDPPYGLPDQQNSALREVEFFGVYKVDTKGVVTLLIDKLSRPNGIAFNPDYTVCYVTVSDPQKAVIMAYKMDSAGAFINERVFFDATPLLPDRKGLPDGIKVHAPSGYVFSTGPGGVLVFSPEGEHLGTINTEQATANCAFDADYSHLYITADAYLLRIKLIQE